MLIVLYICRRFPFLLQPDQQLLATLVSYRWETKVCRDNTHFLKWVLHTEDETLWRFGDDYSAKSKRFIWYVFLFLLG
jgi:hypothetical protein